MEKTYQNELPKKLRSDLLKRLNQHSEFKESFDFSPNSLHKSNPQWIKKNSKIYKDINNLIQKAALKSTSKTVFLGVIYKTKYAQKLNEKLDQYTKDEEIPLVYDCFLEYCEDIIRQKQKVQQQRQYDELLERLNRHPEFTGQLNLKTSKKHGDKKKQIEGESDRWNFKIQEKKNKEVKFKPLLKKGQDLDQTLTRYINQKFGVSSNKVDLLTASGFGEKRGKTGRNTSSSTLFGLVLTKYKIEIEKRLQQAEDAYFKDGEYDQSYKNKCGFWSIDDQEKAGLPSSESIRAIIFKKSEQTLSDIIKKPKQDTLKNEDLKYLKTFADKSGIYTYKAVHKYIMREYNTKAEIYNIKFSADGGIRKVHYPKKDPQKGRDASSTVAPYPELGEGYILYWSEIPLIGQHDQDPYNSDDQGDNDIYDLNTKFDSNDDKYVDEIGAKNIRIKLKEKLSKDDPFCKKYVKIFVDIYKKNNRCMPRDIKEYIAEHLSNKDDPSYDPNEEKKSLKCVKILKELANKYKEDI